VKWSLLPQCFHFQKRFLMQKAFLNEAIVIFNMFTVENKESSYLIVLIVRSQKAFVVEKAFRKRILRRPCRNYTQKKNVCYLFLVCYTNAQEKVFGSRSVICFGKVLQGTWYSQWYCLSNTHWEEIERKTILISNLFGIKRLLSLSIKSNINVLGDKQTCLGMKNLI